MGDYKLIKGGAGRWNGWYPLPKGTGGDSSPGDGVDEMPEYMLFNVKGQTVTFDIKPMVKGQTVAFDFKPTVSLWT